MFSYKVVPRSELNLMKPSVGTSGGSSRSKTGSSLPMNLGGIEIHQHFANPLTSHAISRIESLQTDVIQHA